VGTAVDFECGPPGSERAVKLTRADFPGRWSEPVGQFPAEPLECATTLGADGIADARFNVFSPMLMAELKRFLRSIPAGDGLVIDLRGNPGGLSIMASGLCGWLSAREFSLGTMHLREGRWNFIVYPQAHAFLGPVAVLIDQRSASTSEIFAAGLQEAGRARVFGETSAGAALPSQFERLPDGDIFQYAIADARTPRGVLIEGRGVTPDDPVAPTLADLAAGRDPALAAAKAWLAGQRLAAKAGAAVNFAQPETP
jgi:carboxyl-terminal processing protease